MYIGIRYFDMNDRQIDAENISTNNLTVANCFCIASLTNATNNESVFVKARIDCVGYGATGNSCAVLIDTNKCLFHALDEENWVNIKELADYLDLFLIQAGNSDESTTELNACYCPHDDITFIMVDTVNPVTGKIDGTLCAGFHYGEPDTVDNTVYADGDMLAVFNEANW